MSINKKKSGIMYIRKRKRSKEQIALFERNTPTIKGFPEVRKYDYLGITFNE